MSSRILLRVCLCLLLSLQLSAALPAPLAMRTMPLNETHTESSDPVDQGSAISIEYPAPAEVRSEQRQRRLGSRPILSLRRSSVLNRPLAESQRQREPISFAERRPPMHC